MDTYVIATDINPGEIAIISAGKVDNYHAGEGHMIFVFCNRQPQYVG